MRIAVRARFVVLFVLLVLLYDEVDGEHRALHGEGELQNSSIQLCEHCDLQIITRRTALASLPIPSPSSLTVYLLRRLLRPHLLP